MLVKWETMLLLKKKRVSDVSALPDWFRTMLHRFFADKFSLLGKIIETVGEPAFFKNCGQNHSEIVRKIMSRVSPLIPTATADDVFEIVSFLEKKGVLLENLSCTDEETAKDLLNKINKIETFS